MVPPLQASVAVGRNVIACAAADVVAEAVARPAASEARSRRPRSFQAERTERTRGSYSTAALAEANAIRRPAHSRQRATGQAVGAPQRAQTGAAIRGSRPAHVAQSVAPGIAQTMHRRGNSRSRNT
jgi:hypothetical protein